MHFFQRKRKEANGLIPVHPLPSSAAQSGRYRRRNWQRQDDAGASNDLGPRVGFQLDVALPHRLYPATQNQVRLKTGCLMMIFLLVTVRLLISSSKYCALALCLLTHPQSAISVARHVAKDRHETVGESVGFAVRVSAQPPRWPAHILYCTTGHLLKSLEDDASLQKVRCCLIEATEWSSNQHPMNFIFDLVPLFFPSLHCRSRTLLWTKCTSATCILTFCWRCCAALSSGEKI